MTRVLNHIEVQSPNLSHTIGQVLMKPVSYAFGHTYRLENGIHQLSDPSLFKRIMAAALAILLFPVTLAAAGLGAILLAFSASHQRGYREVKSGIRVTWNHGLPEIRSRQITLRPIKLEDLPVYQNLFNNAVAMARYGNGPRDITNRFHEWLGRWRFQSLQKNHSNSTGAFSALAVVDPAVDRVIGHAIIGHGDFEGNFNKGWSEGAMVIDPAYWNSDHKDVARGIGTADKKHIGSEAVRCCIEYARSLKERNALVPSDVTADQRPIVEEAIRNRKHLSVRLDANGQIEQIYLPFTELRATSRKDNTGMYKYLERIQALTPGSQKIPNTAERDLFVMNL